jgi:ribosomal protein S18 acetylase RimI-like enzyme
MTSVLDNPVWNALNGAHAHFSEGADLVKRYLPAVCPFGAVASEALTADGPKPAAWVQLVELLGPQASLLLTERPKSIPPGWQLVAAIPGLQMIATSALTDKPDPEAEPLGAEDVAEMLDLVARTQPGPFLPRTYELGGYLGLRSGGRLIAMAGQRMRPAGWSEISAVCTDPSVRGLGLGRRLVSAVSHTIRQRGETPFLHAAASNLNAIRLYAAMGFEVRRDVTFAVLKTP